jgi:hypothetical protein
MTYILDIQKALELPKGKYFFKSRGGYCAFGACFESMGLCESGSIKPPALEYFKDSTGRYTKPEFMPIVDLNNSGHFEKATRLAIQKILQDGFAVPAESDLELAKELLAQPEVACK